MDDEPLVIHRRARNPKQVVEKPVKIKRRRKPVEHKCKSCENRAEKEAQYWQQVAEASKAMQPTITTAYVGTWGTTPNYPTYNPTSWTAGYTPGTSWTTSYNNVGSFVYLANES